MDCTDMHTIYVGVRIACINKRVYYLPTYLLTYERNDSVNPS